MGGSNSIITERTDDHIPMKENIMRMDGFFSRISYSTFKSSILPLISDKPADLGKLLYEDQQLPSDFKIKARELEEYSERQVNLITFIGTWMFCKLPINQLRFGNIFTGVSLFDRYVLALTVPSLIFGFGYTKELVSQLDFISVENLLFTNKKDVYIRQYRKRLVEAHPDYARKRYTFDSEWLNMDGVNPLMFSQTMESKEKNEKAGNSNEEGRLKEGEVMEEEEEEELTASQLEYLQILEMEKNQNK